VVHATSKAEGDSSMVKVVGAGVTPYGILVMADNTGTRVMPLEQMRGLLDRCPGTCCIFMLSRVIYVRIFV
jgi:hypothetical protein